MAKASSVWPASLPRGRPTPPRGRLSRHAEGLPRLVEDFPATRKTSASRGRRPHPAEDVRIPRKTYSAAWKPFLSRGRPPASRGKTSVSRGRLPCLAEDLLRCVEAFPVTRKTSRVSRKDVRVSRKDVRVSRKTSVSRGRLPCLAEDVRVSRKTYSAAWKPFLSRGRPPASRGKTSVSRGRLPCLVEYFRVSWNTSASRGRLPCLEAAVARCHVNDQLSLKHLHSPGLRGPRRNFDRECKIRLPFSDFLWA
jgi:hypothetical protein